MDKEEEKIEQFLKSRTEAVLPSREIFNITINRVTSEMPNRNNREKSDYKLINFFMTKGQYAGLALGVIAIILVVSVSKTPSRQVAVNNNDGTVQSQTQVNNDKGAVDPKSQSADAIMASFYADADADGVNANAESEEDAYMNSQVDAFISYNQTQYENNF